ncbi:hypothetical protein PFDG_02459 [Plasmodium falciparum Dd2]|uniref:Uncharacterized protein n=1 Tax=Plasmodium falciparum (isolate Dd2) TaxID=57267 RepID=A0A0L7M1G6_PLAF4|nr:hypothetical protein PFDG_02459 [Plasmodium falciparum Dd2]
MDCDDLYVSPNNNVEKNIYQEDIHMKDENNDLSLNCINNTHLNEKSISETKEIIGKKVRQDIIHTNDENVMLEIQDDEENKLIRNVEKHMDQPIFSGSSMSYSFDKEKYLYRSNDMSDTNYVCQDEIHSIISPDEEKKNSLQSLSNQNLEIAYELTSNDNLDNDENYESFDNHPDDYKTSNKDMDENDKLTTNEMNNMYHDQNIPFLKNEYTYNNVLTKEDKENIDLQKIKDKYEKFTLNLNNQMDDNNNNKVNQINFNENNNKNDMCQEKEKRQLHYETSQEEKKNMSNEIINNDNSTNQQVHGKKKDLINTHIYSSKNNNNHIHNSDQELIIFKNNINCVKNNEVIIMG